MKIAIIVAMDCNRYIGKDNQLPWHLSADLRNFKQITMGKPIIMGRKTHESINRVLPGRENIILTRNKNYNPAGCTVLHNVESVLEYCQNMPEIIIMGGEQIYTQFLQQAEKIYLTKVHTKTDGDTQFPEIDPSQWELISQQDFKQDSKNEFDYSFSILERIIS